MQNYACALIILWFYAGSILAAFSTLNTTAVQQAIKNGVAVIDIRHQDEWQKYGLIAGSHKLTFFDAQGKYNAQKWLNDLSKIVNDKDQPFILVCAHANRTKTVGRFLSEKIGYKNVQELGGGIINGWITKGLKTTKKIPKKAWWQFW